jgi:hypothetical protein
VAAPGGRCGDAVPVGEGAHEPTGRGPGGRGGLLGGRVSGDVYGVAEGSGCGGVRGFLRSAAGDEGCDASRKQQRHRELERGLNGLAATRETRIRTIKDIAAEYLEDYRLRHRGVTFAEYAIGHVVRLLGDRMAVEIGESTVKDRGRLRASGGDLGGAYLQPAQAAQLSPVREHITRLGSLHRFDSDSMVRSKPPSYSSVATRQARRPRLSADLPVPW